MNNNAVSDELEYGLPISSYKSKSDSDDLEKFKSAIKFLRFMQEHKAIDDKQFEDLVVHFAAIFLANVVDVSVNRSLDKALHKIQSNLWRAF